MTPDFDQDHFKMFGLPVRFGIDVTQLDQAYRKVQAEVHPDRYSVGSGAEKRLSMQWATRANEAYQTLKKPVARARYLLALAGIDTQEETNTAMPPQFLVQQMTWRELVTEARGQRDVGGLDAVAGELRTLERALHLELARSLDDSPDHGHAAGLVRKLRFLEKLAEEIRAAQESMEH